MEKCTVEQFIAMHGVTCELSRGRWQSWDKLGVWRLRGRDQHVIPLIWDQVSGTAWVRQPAGAGGQLLLVRVENLIRYKTALTDSIEDGESTRKPRAATTKVPKDLPTTAEELLAALGM